MDWEPRTVTTDEVLDPGPVAALAALFDDGLPTPRPGDPLPPLWHWVALPRWCPSSQLGSDGHPRRGDFLPPVKLPRRMFAGGSAEYSGTLRVGDEVRREAIVESVTEKSGRSGTLVIVVTSTTLIGPNGSLTEKQNLIYREASPATDQAATPSNEPVGAPLSADGRRWRFRTDPTLLMRFSAATANAHRIHYDWPYATGVEGYPGLVVHGPLQTLALAEAHRLDDGSPVTALAHRTNAPLFCEQTATISARPTDTGKTVELFGPDAEHPGTTLGLTLAGRKD
ncbi:MAG: MaoC family dehydratase N-terminal domain-containing protein [Gordonia sp. (in: high G+C Gram-positive bacteria)]|uniref:FAS1-like dehydratase domain-containing protein n=1 Tax=Gordonia sp. (in: high G+C Gram-positive bacteria) TaxID=84139 RepID=UPI0039E66C6D